MQTSSDQVSEKWIDVLSTPIDPAEATEVIGDLYELIGHPLPKIVFVDSPWATSIAAELLVQQSSSTLTSVREGLLNLSNQVYDQLLQQYIEKFDPNLFDWNDWNIKSNRMEARDLAGRLSDLAGTKIYYSKVSEDYYGYDATADPWYGYRRTQLDDLSILATRFKQFGHRSEHRPQSAAWHHLLSPLTIPSCRGANLNKDWISKLLHYLDHRLIQQLGIRVNQLPLESEVYSFPLSKPIWFSSIPDASIFDLAASHEIQFEPKLLTVFLRAALHLGFINPFKEICFVSDRPCFKRDTQNNLHAEGEPAIVFPDSFGMDYFHHGTALPQYIGSVHPSQWQPHWILQERNAEVRRCLIQEIGYARICQELQAEELDCWREYALLKLPIYDDYSRIPVLRPWERPEEVKGEAVYLLKMTCPSTGCIYAIRVPPNMRSARKAATWINWDSDPEWFAWET
ncbi:MAG: hypothetical protein IGR93_15685 [Hydrococcus sp. C42_A2020_068]|nr:hypothetical protein [Hydrococcus sp. C42_A2020_068]